VLHDPHLGHTVGDEGGGGEDGGPPAVGVAQVLEFEVEVGGPFGLAADDAGNAGGKRQVLKQVGFVDLCRRRHKSTYADGATMPIVEVR
jgi:hypothetical protein